MHNISKFILTFFIAIPLVFAFGSQTVKQIDEIKNNTGTDIVLNPTDKVKINYFTGEKALQSTVDGELEESSITNTELGFLSGVTSSIQTQIDAKQDILTGTDGDLYYWNSGLANLAIGTNGQILQVSALGFPEWVDLPPAVSVTTKGDLQTYSTQADRLAVGTDGQVLSANSATSTGLEWIDPDFYNSPLTTDGDLLYYNSASEQRLPIGTEDQVLTVNASGLPVWADAAAGGGSAGINFVVDPSFEKGDLNPDTDASATESYQLYSADDKLYSQKINEQYYRAAYTGLTANNTYIRDTFARTGLDGKQGLFSIWIKGNADQFELCLRTDDSSFATTCDDAYKLNIIGDDTWRKYEIPFVYGSTSVEYEIKNASYTGDVTIEIDNIYVGTMPDGYIQTVGQAHFVGSLNYQNTGCVWSTSNTTMASLPVDADCTSSLITGKLQAPTTKIPAIKIPNARTDGYYRVEVQGLFYQQNTTSGSCIFSMSSTGSYDDQGVFILEGLNSRADGSLSGDFKFNTTGDKEVEVVANSSNGTATCSIYANNIYPMKWSVHFYPDSTSTIVTQDTELTAKTANEFSATYQASTGNILRSNYDFIQSCTSQASGRFTCTFNTGLFEAIPSVQLTSYRNTTDAWITSCRVESISTSSFVGQCNRVNTSSIAENSDVFISVSKQGADVNKSATIVGKFRNINSSELIFVDTYRPTNQTVGTTDTIILYNTVRDNNCGSCFNTSTGTFTAPKSSKYLIRARAYMSQPDTYARCYISKNHSTTPSNIAFSQERLPVSGNQTVFIDTIAKIDENETLNVICQTGNASNVIQGSSSANLFQIQELPDTESIIKNLSNQKVECQTKILGSNITSAGDVADLTFTNLDTSKYYSVSSNVRYSTNRTAGTKYVYGRITGFERNLLGYDEDSNSGTVYERTVQMNAKRIKPTSSTVQFNINIILRAQVRAASWVEICELPDTYVETTKF